MNLCCKNLGLAAGQKWLLQKIDLTFENAQFIALIGQNGAGKSSLLRLLAGLLSPSTGTISLANKPLSSYSRQSIARQIAFVATSMSNSQNITDFQVSEIVMQGRYPYLNRFQSPTQTDENCVTQALIETDLIALQHRRFSSLSTGEKQRVWLARALASEANFLLLDEPTANLDLAHTLQLANLCQRWAKNQEKCIIWAVHDINLALQYADKIIILQQGQLFWSGAPFALTSQDIEQAFQVLPTAVMGPLGRFFVYQVI